jgi:lipopolysaccharide export system protein LptA
MLRSEAARYARWSALVALVLAGITATVYVQRHWKSYVDKRDAPPPAPVDVSRQSAGIHFKQGDKNRTIYEVAASKSTEFKGQDASLLEDVKITIFGKTGERHDVIHTWSCQYGKDNGGIVCSGDVHIDLMSAQDAERAHGNPEAEKALSTHVETRAVQFDRASGLARTEQRVTFTFPSGSGEAVGLQYNSEEGTVRLLREVQLTLAPQKSAGKKSAPSADARPAQEVRVRGASLDFGRDTRVMNLTGPAEAQTSSERLTAGAIRLALDKDFRAQTLVATGVGEHRPTVTSQGARDQMKLEADTLTAHFSPEGSLTKLDATGGVHGLRTGAVEQDEARADSGSLDLFPGVNQPKELNLNGAVLLSTQGVNGGDSRMLQTSAFRMQFSAAESGRSARPQKAETLDAGTMEWTDTSAQPGAATAKTKLRAARLALDFGAEGKARLLAADGNVQTERAVTGRPLQVATARHGVAELQPSGGWSQMNLEDDVKLREGDRSGQGEHAVFVRATQTATLTGNAVARDASTETRAPKITFAQGTGDIHAEGGVRSTDFSSRTSVVQLAPVPANITADTLQANSKSGRALYSGHARLWQGDSVLEAESIELLRETRVLNAHGNVRAVFPQAAAQPPGTATEQTNERIAAIAPVQIKAVQGTSKKSQLWHANCAALTYWDSQNRAHLEKNVVVQSAEIQMRAPVLDLFFTRAAPAGQNASSAANPAAGAQQISRALGTGGVTVVEGVRKAVSERGEYTAATGKFVMSGGNPTLFDGSAGTTTGRQLTFFLADDTIIVDSENGSRTLTKHRVEK